MVAGTRPKILNATKKSVILHNDRREVATLVDSVGERGLHQVIWDASRYSTGLYFIRLTSRENNGRISMQSMKAVFVK